MRNPTSCAKKLLAHFSQLALCIWYKTGFNDAVLNSSMKMRKGKKVNSSIRYNLAKGKFVVRLKLWDNRLEHSLEGTNFPAVKTQSSSLHFTALTW